MSLDEIPVVQYGESGPIATNDFWWKSPKNEVHRNVFPVVQKIKQLQNYRKLENIRYGRVYSNTEFDRYISGVTTGFSGNKISFNLAKSVVDTATAKMAQNKTRPLFLTQKGSKKQQNRAKKLTQYIDGCFFQGKAYEEGSKCFRDACIFGTGALKVVEIEGQIKYERTFIDEIVVDDVDGRMAKPRQMHHAKPVHREVLLDMFQKDAKAKEAITIADAIVKPTKAGVVDFLQVVESWHLPSGSEAKDGRHTICIKNTTLLDEEWKQPFFPFAFMRWSDPILGFFGEGLIAEVIGIQLEINTLLQRIKEAQELMAVPRIALEESSSVSSSHITDEIGGIIKYRGTEPKALNWTAMNPEIYSYLEYLWKKGFEAPGVSQLSASSKKPAGLDSGVAIREYQDIETERFKTVATNYQSFFLDLATITIAAQREMAEEDSKLSVNVKGKKFIETIKWKEVDIDDDKFIMQVFPTNFLPKTPEGQLAYVQELIQSGFIDPDWGMSLLEFPDLQGFFNIKTAAIDDIIFIIDKIVEDEEYTPPEEYQNLQLCVSLGQAAYLRAKTDGTSETSLELLQRFVDESQDLLTEMNPPPPELAQAPGGQPGATAIADRPPRSDLIPQINGAPPQ